MTTPRIFSCSSVTMLGFTLVEMLVSLGIIALLASSVFMVTSKAMDKVNAGKCLSNFRKMGQAMALYVADNDGSLPGPISAGQTTFYSIRPNGTVRLDGSLLAILQPYLGEPSITPSGKDELAYPLLCPAWEKQRAVAGRSKSGVSFQANDLVAGNYSRKEIPKKLSAVNSPSLVRMAWEIDSLSDYNPGNPNLISKPAHKNFRHCLFLDGHVEALAVEER